MDKHRKQKTESGGKRKEGEKGNETEKKIHRELSEKQETESERGGQDGGMEVAQGAEEGDLTQIGRQTAAAAE